MRPKYVSNLIFLAGLVGAAGLALGLDTAVSRPLSRISELDGYAEATRDFAALVQRPLTANELRAARTAWRYIERNTQPETGWVNAVDGFPSSTLWDQGAYVFALIAARRLDLIGDAAFLDRARQFLRSTAALPLFEGRLPNKAYNTLTLTQTDYLNNAAADGIGWSVLDIGRFLAALSALGRQAPELAAEIAAVTDAWVLDDLVRDGDLMGAAREDGTWRRLQEGRLGYEQYAARALSLYGIDTSQAIRAADKIRWRRISGREVATDRRRYADFGAITPILSEPYVLSLLEFGAGTEMSLPAMRIYEAQAAEGERTGRALMVSEDHIDRAPYFLYSSVFANGQDWAVIDEVGTLYPGLRTLSTKSVFAWHALLSTAYTTRLMAEIAPLENPARGWAGGIYEADGQINAALSLNTNAVILEALHYRQFGPFLKRRTRNSNQTEN